MRKREATAKAQRLANSSRFPAYVYRVALEDGADGWEVARSHAGMFTEYRHTVDNWFAVWPTTPSVEARWR